MPRIVLFERNSPPDSLLHVGCVNDSEMDLYVIWLKRFAVPSLPGTRPLPKEVTYRIDDGEPVTRHWGPGKYETDREAFFAPPGVARTIIMAMLEGAERIEIRLVSSRNLEIMEIAGFPVAAEPLLEHCG